MTLEEQAAINQLMAALPPHWFQSRPGSSLWMNGYLAFRVDGGAIGNEPKHMHLGDVVATLRDGGFKYWDIGHPRVTAVNGAPTFEMSGPSQIEASGGHFLILTTHHDRDGKSGNEPATRARLAMAAALLATVFGRNIVYHKIFENILNLESLQTHMLSPVFENPNWFPLVEPVKVRITLVERLAAALHQLPDPARNRVELSLRWYEDAVFARGVDAFLKYWISIETVAMPDTSNIRPLEELFASAYGMSFLTARSTFQIGKIFGLRSRIVHDGDIVPVHGNLLLYLEALYVDALYATLREPLEKRAQSVLGMRDFSLGAYIS
jgi:hypothetical protein